SARAVGKVLVRGDARGEVADLPFAGRGPPTAGDDVGGNHSVVLAHDVGQPVPRAAGDVEVALRDQLRQGMQRGLGERDVLAGGVAGRGAGRGRGNRGGAAARRAGERVDEFG